MYPKMPFSVWESPTLETPVLPFAFNHCVQTIFERNKRSKLSIVGVSHCRVMGSVVKSIGNEIAQRWWIRPTCLPLNVTTSTTFTSPSVRYLVCFHSFKNFGKWDWFGAEDVFLLERFVDPERQRSHFRVVSYFSRTSLREKKHKKKV